MKKHSSSIVFTILLGGWVFACSSSSSSGNHATNTDGGPGTGTSSQDGSPTGTGGDPTMDGGKGGGNTDGGSGSDATPPPDLWNVTAESVAVGGTMRTYTQSVPKNYDANKSYPVVLAFHGDGGDGASLRTYFTIEAASGTDAIVIYPDGVGGTWDLYDADPANLDFAFMDSLLVALAGKLNIDKTRVFGVGWSNGGFFVNTLACFRPAMMAAYASNSGGQPDTRDGTYPATYPNGYYKCTTTEAPVASLIVQGAADTLVDPSSGDYDALYWAYVNGCTAPDQSTPTTPSPCVNTTGCPAGEAVVYCKIPGMGHAIWSETIPTAWAFFKQMRP